MTLCSLIMLCSLLCAICSACWAVRFQELGAGFPTQLVSSFSLWINTNSFLHLCSFCRIAGFFCHFTILGLHSVASCLPDSVPTALVGAQVQAVVPRTVVLRTGLEGILMTPELKGSLRRASLLLLIDPMRVTHRCCSPSTPGESASLILKAS